MTEETSVPVAFAAAVARLANLRSSGALLTASEHSYDEGAVGVLRVGPAPGITLIVRAEFRDLVTRGNSAVLTLRWEVTGAAGALFPVLDADITIVPSGDGQATSLRLDGAYRAPLGTVGASLDRLALHRVASATVRAFVGRVAGLIAHPDPEVQTEFGERHWSPEPETT